jgi:hypothetical protein
MTEEPMTNFLQIENSAAAVHPIAKPVHSSFVILASSLSTATFHPAASQIL